MQVSIIVKEVNSGFRQDIADKFNDGKETVDNMHYNWEDEYAVRGAVESFKVRNNVSFQLQGFRGEEAFSIEIPGMMIIDCTGDDGVLTQFAFSRRLVKDTHRVDRPDGQVRFFVFIRDSKAHVSPQPGVYVLTSEWPEGLPLPETDEEDEEDDEEEEVEDWESDDELAEDSDSVNSAADDEEWPEREAPETTN